MRTSRLLLRFGRALGPLFAGLLLTAAGCSVPIASDLDDAEANRVFVALDRANVDATKDPDPAAEGKWRIAVPRDDVARALSVMREELLPRREPPGVLEAMSKESLVPSEAAEQAQLITGIAGDLERSLEGVDGVLQARVHLSLPPPLALPTGGASLAAGAAAGAARSTASVLVEHRGATPPLSADAVQRLVAGGVAGLLPTDVAVIMVPRDALASYSAYASTDLAHVGPIAVARASVRRLQGALTALVGLVAVLACATLALYARLARARPTMTREAAFAPQATGAGAVGGHAAIDSARGPMGGGPPRSDLRSPPRTS